MQGFIIAMSTLIFQGICDVRKMNSFNVSNWKCYYFCFIYFLFVCLPFHLSKVEASMAIRNWEMNAKRFYLLLYWIALRTVSLSPLVNYTCLVFISPCLISLSYNHKTAKPPPCVRLLVRGKAHNHLYYVGYYHLQYLWMMQ